MPTTLKQQGRRQTATRTTGILIAAAVLCFGMLHIIGGTMLRYHPAPPTVDTVSGIADHGD